MVLDNQIRVSTIHAGLKYWQYDEKEAVWQDWRTWPCLCVASDKGPDCEAGISALLCKLNLNLIKYEDISHGVNRCFDNTLTDCGCKGLWLLMLVSWNVPRGWEREALRLQQLKGTMMQWVLSISGFKGKLVLHRVQILSA